MLVDFQLTEQDLENSVHASITSCLVATCIRRTVPGRDIRVGMKDCSISSTDKQKKDKDNIFNYRKPHTYALPYHVVEAIYDFEGGIKKPNLCSFSLNLVE